MEFDCLSVGVLVADHLCAPISHLPRAGELVLTDQLLLSIGGCASNAAIDLVRLGVRVRVVGCVGDDLFGQFIVKSLEDVGVNCTSILRRADAQTSGTLIVNVSGEDRRFIHTMGANARLTAADISREQIERAKVFYVGGYLLMPGLDQLELAELFRHARKHGVTTVLDVVLPGAGDHMRQLEKLLPETDVFLPNNDEAELITGLTDPRQQARRLHEAGATTVVITCGARGTVLVSKGLRLHADCYPVTFVGGTGAGDAFDAGYIAGLLSGGDPRTCLTWGSALGASCVRSIGATDSVFTRVEAEAFMREHSLAISNW